MNNFEPKQFGRFYLLEKLAVGGMAEIYKAKTYGAEGFEKLLAIKRILPHCSADKDFITMLIDEAKLSVVLSHANIVQVYDLGKVGDDFFISMEYINGINLRDILYRSREHKIKMPTEIAVYIMSEVCKGLDYAHRKTDSNGAPLNIVHRDVSPQNVLISYEGEVKIVDFGIAKAAMNISHTMAGILKGKIAYMSPEQALGKMIDYRTDVFSTGILLYECLTGEKLFTGESQFEVLKKIRTSKVDVTKLPEVLPKQLQQILIKSLAYFPKDRFQSAGDMQIELTKFLYSTYHDFTPQKLAAHIKTLFQDELDRQQKQAALQRRMEAQTSSINLSQEAIQQDIVVREETGATQRGVTAPTLRAPSHELQPEEQTEHTARIHRRAMGLRVAATIGILAAVAIGTYGYVRFLHPRFFPSVEHIAQYGSVQISSTPAGARVFLDGRDMSRLTPTTLDQIALNTSHTIRLAKEKYTDLDKTFSLTSTAPMSIALTMTEITPQQTIASQTTTPTTTSPTTQTAPTQQTQTPPATTTPATTAPVVTQTGAIRIVSDPPGASILLNGRGTGKVTPSTIGNLALNQRYTISVNKKEFEGWSRSVTLKEPTTVTVSGNLKSKATATTTATTTPTTTTSTTTTPTVTSNNTPQTKPPTGKDVNNKTPPPTTNAGSGPGSIRVSSSPSGADVFVNGESRGSTPTTIAGLSGSVKVLVTKEGYAPWSTRVTVKPGETVSLGTVSLGDLYGEVSVSSSPTGATVYIDGQPASKTPVTIRKVRRDKGHSVRVELSGHKTWERSFTFGNEGEKKFHADMQEE